MSDENIVFNTKEVAEYLGVSFSLIRKLIRNKKIPYYNPGDSKIIRFRKSVIDEWITKQERRNYHG